MSRIKVKKVPPHKKDIKISRISINLQFITQQDVLILAFFSYCAH